MRTLILLCTYGSFALCSEPLIFQVEKPIQLNASSRSLSLTSTQLIRADQARKYYNIDGKGVSVAILDTGIADLYGDFGNRIIVRKDFIGEGLVWDEHGHGTFMAGVIGANGPNIGVAPGANLIVLRIGDKYGTILSSGVIDALKWVERNKDAYRIVAINMSFSAGNYSNDDVFSDTETTKIIRFLSSAGVAIIVASGNKFKTYDSIQGLGFPAIIKETISTGAVFSGNMQLNALGDAIAYSSENDRITPYSQRLHESVARECGMDILAPGTYVKSSSIGTSPFAFMSGTSSACAMVSGAVALIQEYSLRESGRLLTVRELQELLRVSGSLINDGDDEDDNVINTGMDWPRIDIQKALVCYSGYSTESLEVTKLSFRLNGSKQNKDRLTAVLKLASEKPLSFYEGPLILKIGSQLVRKDVLYNGLIFEKAGKMRPIDGGYIVKVNLKKAALGVLDQIGQDYTTTFSLEIGGIVYEQNIKVRLKNNSGKFP